MKPPRPKIHILEVSDPLLAYHNLKVSCDLVLRNASPQYMRTNDLRDQVSRPPNMCRKCLDTSPEHLRYEYGLMEAQEERDSEHYEAVEEVA